MKKIVFFLALIGLTSLIFLGCPNTLSTNLPADSVITIGRFNPTNNSTIYGAVGGTLSVPVTISDQTGRIAAGDYTVVFTLSLDADLATTVDNTDLGTGSTVTAGAEQIVELTMPAALTPGTYTLFAAISDAGDTVINNNTAAATADIGAANQPDLEIISLSIGRDLPVYLPGYLPGAAGTLNYKIQNTGYASIASGTTFTMNYTLDFTPDPDPEVGSTSITLAETLYPRGFITGIANFTMPTTALLAADNSETEETFSYSSWTLTATVDSGDAIAEISEVNNTNTVSISSGSEKPELSVTSVTIPTYTSYAKTGNPLEYAVTIENNGLAAASGYSVSLFVDNNDNRSNDTGDVALYTWSTPPDVPFDITGDIDGNYHNTIILSIPDGETYPSGIADGTHRVRAEISGLTEEWDSTDNTSDNGSSLNVVFTSIAYDLEMYSMSTTLVDAVDEATGGSIPLSLRIANNGEDAVETDFDIHFYARSVDATLTPGSDTDLGTITITATIPGNGKSIVTNTVTFPGGEGVGFYTLYWDLDESDVVAEFDESNNTVSDADECFVFFPVSDGSTDITANLIAYNPIGGRTGTNSLYMKYYYNNWAFYYGYYTGYDIDPGERFIGHDFSLTPGSQYGIEFNEYYYSRTGTGLPYTFRFIPSYVDYVPVSALPYALGAEDTFEDNDSTSTAAFLSGSDNPLTGFVNAFTITPSYGNEDKDFYLFDMP